MLINFSDTFYCMIIFIFKLKPLCNILDDSYLYTLKQKLIDTNMLCYFEFTLLMFDIRCQVNIYTFIYNKINCLKKFSLKISSKHIFSVSKHFLYKSN